MAINILNISEKNNGGRLKAIAWAVEKSKDFPEGVKYAFAYIINNQRVIGYDNERTKGHHRHFITEDGTLAEEKTKFTDINETFKLFVKEVREFKNKPESKQDTNKNPK